jgi:hypothetical protein
VAPAFKAEGVEEISHIEVAEVGCMILMAVPTGLAVNIVCKRRLV